MPIIIIEEPSRTHVESPLRRSKWASSRHPYLFKLWRADIIIESWVDNGGLLRLIANTFQTPASELVVGSKIYVKDNDNKYANAGTVTAVVNTGTPNYLFDTDIPYNGIPVTGGYINVLDRLNYFIEVEIKGTDPVSQIFRTWAKIRVDTDNEGFGRLNVQGCINGYVDKINDYNYITKNVIDPWVFGSFSLKYTGKWLNGEEPVVYTDPNVYLFVDNVKSLLAKYGQNLCDYVPFADGTLVEKAKFLSDFEKPTYFIGYPFDLSAIIPSVFGISVGMTANEERFLLNGNSDGTQDEAMLLYKADTVQRIRPMGGYASTIEQIDFWLQADSVPASTYYENGYIDPLYFESFGGSVISPYRVTEKKRIKLVRPCEKNVIYLAWRNTKGGWSYWLFNKMQEVSVSTILGATFGTEPDNLETAMAREINTTATQTEKITLGAQVLIEDLSGLKHLEGSPRIQMLASLDPLKWITVRVAPKGVKYRTDALNVIVEFDILLPELYTVPN